MQVSSGEGKTSALVQRLLWVMAHGPRGPMRQIDIVNRSAGLGDGLTKAEVNRLVNGATDPKYSTLEKLSRALGVTVAELVPSIRRRHLIAHEIDQQLVVLDLEQRQPADGLLVAIRHPATGRLMVMWVAVDGDRFRFANDAEYVIGDADLCIGEVVLTASSLAVRTTHREAWAELGRLTPGG